MDSLRTVPADPEALMRTVTAAFEVGDLRPLAAAVHKDIVWKSASSDGNLFRFAGVRERGSGVVEVTGEIASEYLFQRFQPREITAKGDIVWGLFDAVVKYQPVGDRRVYPLAVLEIAIRWRIQDGKIIEHQTFFDTAALLQQRREVQP